MEVNNSVIKPTEFKPRGYQVEILDRTLTNTLRGLNTIIELDCGSGKRYLQYELIAKRFREKNILLLLQASTSLYETYRYFRDVYGLRSVEMIDSRLPSKNRAYKLRNAKVVLSLPQTLMNTLKVDPDAIDHFDIVLINEVDQLIRRRSTSSSLKQPYGKLLEFFRDKTIIGMSGTLRDEHYIEDNQQLIIRDELNTLVDYFKGAQLITMDELMTTDISEYIAVTSIIPTAVEDENMANLTMELQAHIEEAREEILQSLEEEDPALAKEIRDRPSKIFNTYLPVEEELLQKFNKGYLVRKYLWGLPGEDSKKHLYSYGLDPQWVRDTIRDVPGKFHKTFDLVKHAQKSVVLCSYLSTCDLLESRLHQMGIGTIKITGRIPHKKRDEILQEFRQADKQMVAIISNVGERDLDIPEAELLIVFDLVRTTKTVYQKLKRTRGGECRILFYNGTDEVKKVSSVTKSIREKYPWSTEIVTE